MEFFLELGSVSKTNGLYKIGKKYGVSDFHSRIVLSYFQDKGIIVYHWDKNLFTYAIVFTPLGVKVRKKLQDLRNVLVKNKIWRVGLYGK